MADQQLISGQYYARFTCASCCGTVDFVADRLAGTQREASNSHNAYCVQEDLQPRPKTITAGMGTVLRIGGIATPRNYPVLVLGTICARTD